MKINSDLDREDSTYLESLQMELAKCDLYIEYKQAIKKLRNELHTKYIHFENSANQTFAKEVFYRIMEESVAYLGNLSVGAFFAANHHTRSLLELNAMVEYVFSKAGKEQKFIERFNLYPHLDFHRIFYQYEDASLKLPEDICKNFFSSYKELTPEIFNAFNTSKNEKLLKLRTWLGNARIVDLFKKCTHPKIIKENYDKLSLFTHLSSICRRSETEIFPKFSESTEKMLLITIRYAIFSFLIIKQEGVLDFLTQDRLDNIFLPLSDILTKAHSKLGFTIPT